MTSQKPVQQQTDPTLVTRGPTPADKPKSDEAKRLMEQERAALDNVRDGYGHPPSDTSPASEETFDETARGGTEPTHLPTTGSDRRA